MVAGAVANYNGEGQQTLRIPEAGSGGLDPAKEVFWNYLPNGKLANRTDQQGQPISYTYDADGNLVCSHDASGLTDSSQTPVDTQNTYDDLDQLVRSDLKKQSDANWTFSSFGYDLNGNITDQNQNGQEQSPGGPLVKDGHKLHSDYDSANWLTDQIDSTLNQRVLNTFTPVGLESRREIDQSNGSGGWTAKQTTAWDYFPNGKLNHLTTANGSGATLESHAVSYLDGSGLYVDGNRIQDVYSLRPGGSASTPCYPGTCTANYGYDPQDRLVSQADIRGSTTTTTTYTLDAAGNILTQATNGSTTTTNTYSGNQLQQSVSGGQTLKYWYDNLGRQQCVTDANGTQANCNPSENTTASTDLVSDYRYDYLDRLQTYRAFSGGNRTDEANYVYDALNRTVQEQEQHPSFNGDTHTTQFSYVGMSSQDAEEQQSSKNSGSLLSVKDFTYDAYGHRLAMTATPYTNGQPGTPTTYTYGQDVHGSVSQLVDPNGNTTASYGYKPYGQSDSQLSQGDTDKTNPLNPFRYSAKRMDSGSGTLDMGVRRFGPDISHFLTPDFFYGSLANLSLSTDPLTGNRYDLAGGNPISYKERQGHDFTADGGGGAITDPTPASPVANLGPADRCGGCEDPAVQPVTSSSRPSSQPSGQSLWDRGADAWNSLVTAVKDNPVSIASWAFHALGGAGEEGGKQLQEKGGQIIEAAYTRAEEIRTAAIRLSPVTWPILRNVRAFGTELAGEIKGGLVEELGATSRIAGGGLVGVGSGIAGVMSGIEDYNHNRLSGQDRVYHAIAVGVGAAVGSGVGAVAGTAGASLACSWAGGFALLCGAAGGIVGGILGEKAGGAAGAWIYENRNQIGAALQQGSQWEQQGGCYGGCTN